MKNSRSNYDMTLINFVCSKLNVLNREVYEILSEARIHMFRSSPASTFLETYEEILMIILESRRFYQLHNLINDLISEISLLKKSKFTADVTLDHFHKQDEEVSLNVMAPKGIEFVEFLDIESLNNDYKEDFGVDWNDTDNAFSHKVKFIVNNDIILLPPLKHLKSIKGKEKLELYGFRESCIDIS